MLQYVERQAEIHINVKLHKKVTSLRDGRTKISVLQGYCESGKYLTLFDIGTGGGSTNLDKRREWERRIFDTAYDGFDKQRPRYGNVNVLAHDKGDKEAARYGQSMLVLKEHVRRRCTVTSRDSSKEDAVLGTLDHFAHVLLHAVELCDSAEPPVPRATFLQQLDQLAKYEDGTITFPEKKVHLARW